MERRLGERKNRQVWIRFHRESSDFRKLRFVETVDGEAATLDSLREVRNLIYMEDRIVARDEQSL